MGLIRLQGIEFYAYHGVYQEEKEKGNKFVVHVAVDYPFEDSSSSDDLQKTLDYEEIYNLVAENMKQSANLLEYLSSKIAQGIKAIDPKIREVIVEVRKYNPPIQGSCEYASAEVHF